MKILTEKTPNRENHIKMASKEGQITLFTVSFARGTDFEVFNPVVKEKGLGVIQTYLSDELSEEVQTKGRTARQGAKGTYQLVLCREALEAKYKITEADLTRARENDGIGKYLNECRKKYMAEVNKNRDEAVEKARLIHEESIALQNQILASKLPRSHDFFFKTVVQLIKPTNICLIFALDESGSMGGQRWNDLMTAYKKAITEFINSPAKSKIRVTLMLFDSSCRIIQESVLPDSVNMSPPFGGGGTAYTPVFQNFLNMSKKYLVDKSSTIKLVFMTDGGAEYPTAPLQQLKLLQLQEPGRIDFYSVEFGCNTDMMKQITRELNGKNTVPSNMNELVNVFSSISRDVIKCTRCS
jgi:hypothetical protein